MKNKILKLMKESHFCVLSTVNNAGQPESALIGFSQNDNLELVFGCNMKSRKYQNLKTHPDVSAVVSQPEKRLTVQYEGHASLLQESKKDNVLKKHFDKLPFAKKYLDQPGQAWFKVVPKWIRYSDYSSDPAFIDEMRFA